MITPKRKAAPLTYADATAQTEDVDAFLGDLAAGLEAPPTEAPEIPERPMPHALATALGDYAPKMDAPDATAVDVDATRERDDIAAGRDRDSSARLMRSIELAGKQFNSAVGGIPVGELANPASTSYERDATARADRGEAKRFTRNQAAAAEQWRRANFDAEATKQKIAQQHQAYLDKQKADRDAWERAEKDEDQELRKDANKASLAQSAAILAATKSERDYKHGKDDDDNARARIKGLPAGWELEDGVELTDKQKQDFGGLVVSSEKMKGLTKRLRELLSKASVTDKILPTALNNQLGQVATQLVIEGKNVAELGALSGPDMGLMNSIAADPSNVRNILKDAGALSAGLDAWADNSVAANAKLGFRRKAAGKASGKILVSNGRETLAIDPGDEQAAAADGYKRVTK